MKTQLKDVFLTQPIEFNPAVPRWVSELGLEWLYNLLAKSEDLWRSPIRQN